MLATPLPALVVCAFFPFPFLLGDLALRSGRGTADRLRPRATGDEDISGMLDDSTIAKESKSSEPSLSLPRLGSSSSLNDTRRPLDLLRPREEDVIGGEDEAGVSHVTGEEGGSEEGGSVASEGDDAEACGYGYMGWRYM